MTDVHELRQLIDRRQPELVPVVDRLESGTVDDDDVDRIQMALVDELIEFGLDAADEPNEYGLRVEHLIDVANHARPEFRSPSRGGQPWRGDSSSEERGGAGRGKVYETLRRGDVATAVAVARGIDHPWYRCQSLAIAAMQVDDPTLRLALVDEALKAADQLGEPNRVVTVASWPMEVLASHGPADRLQIEVRRLLAVAATEPHGLRRADAESVLLHHVWADGAGRQQVLDAFLATCGVAFGWRRDRLLGFLAPRLALVDAPRAEAVVAIIGDPKYRRRAQRDVDAALADAS
jgi:hypothetical protein